MGFCLFGTPGTADLYSEYGIPIKGLVWPTNYKLRHQPHCNCNCHSGEENSEYSILHYLSSSKIALCIILQSKKSYKRPAGYLSNGYFARRKCIDFGIPLFTNLQEAQMFVEAIKTVPMIEIGAPDQLTTHTSHAVHETCASNESTCSCQSDSKTELPQNNNLTEITSTTPKRQNSLKALTAVAVMFALVMAIFVW